MSTRTLFFYILFFFGIHIITVSCGDELQPDPSLPSPSATSAGIPGITTNDDLSSPLSSDRGSDTSHFLPSSSSSSSSSSVEEVEKVENGTNNGTSLRDDTNNGGTDDSIVLKENPTYNDNSLPLSSSTVPETVQEGTETIEPESSVPTDIPSLSMNTPSSATTLSSPIDSDTLSSLPTPPLVPLSSPLPSSSPSPLSTPFETVWTNILRNYTARRMYRNHTTPSGSNIEKDEHTDDISLEDNLPGGIITCPLLHPVYDQIEPYELAIDLNTPLVARCHAGYFDTLLSSSSTVSLSTLFATNPLFAAAYSASRTAFETMDEFSSSSSSSSILPHVHDYLASFRRNSTNSPFSVQHYCKILESDLLLFHKARDYALQRRYIYATRKSLQLHPWNIREMSTSYGLFDSSFTNTTTIPTNQATYNRTLVSMYTWASHGIPFTQWYVNYTVRGIPTLLLDYYPIDESLIKNDTSTKNTDDTVVNQNIQTLIDECSQYTPTNGCLLSSVLFYNTSSSDPSSSLPSFLPHPVSSSLFTALSWINQQIKFPGFIGTSLLQRLDTVEAIYKEQYINPSRTSSNANYRSSSPSVVHSSHRSASVTITTEELLQQLDDTILYWSTQYPRLYASSSVPLQETTNGFHYLLAPLQVPIKVRLYDTSSELSLFYPSLSSVDTIPKEINVWAFDKDHWARNTDDSTLSLNRTDSPFQGGIIHAALHDYGTTAEGYRHLFTEESVAFSSTTKQLANDLTLAHMDLLLNENITPEEFRRRYNTFMEQDGRSIHGINGTNTTFPRILTNHSCPIMYPSFLLAQGWETVIYPGEAVFIPSGFMYTWHTVEKGNSTVSGDGEETKGLVIETAWIDASNIHRVMDTLLTNPLLESNPRLSILLNLLELGLVHSPAFSASSLTSTTATHHLFQDAYTSSTTPVTAESLILQRKFDITLTRYPPRYVNFEEFHLGVYLQHAHNLTTALNITLEDLINFENNETKGTFSMVNKDQSDNNITTDTEETDDNADTETVPTASTKNEETITDTPDDAPSMDSTDETSPNNYEDNNTNNDYPRGLQTDASNEEWNNETSESDSTAGDSVPSISSVPDTEETIDEDISSSPAELERLPGETDAQYRRRQRKATEQKVTTNRKNDKLQKQQEHLQQQQTNKRNQQLNRYRTATTPNTTTTTDSSVSSSLNARRNRARRVSTASSSPVLPASFQAILREKQDEIQWQTMLRTIAFPGPLHPVPIHWGRDNVTLMWHTPPSPVSVSSSSSSSSTNTSQTIVDSAGIIVYWHAEPLISPERMIDAYEQSQRYRLLVSEIAQSKSIKTLTNRKLHSLLDAQKSTNGNDHGEITFQDGTFVTITEYDQKGDTDIRGARQTKENGDTVSSSSSSSSTVLSITADGTLNWGNLIGQLHRDQHQRILHTMIQENLTNHLSIDEYTNTLFGKNGKHNKVNYKRHGSLLSNETLARYTLWEDQLDADIFETARRLRMIAEEVMMEHALVDETTLPLLLQNDTTTNSTSSVMDAYYRPTVTRRRSAFYRRLPGAALTWAKEAGTVLHPLDVITLSESTATSTLAEVMELMKTETDNGANKNVHGRRAQSDVSSPSPSASGGTVPAAWAARLQRQKRKQAETLDHATKAFQHTTNGHVPTTTSERILALGLPLMTNPSVTYQNKDGTIHNRYASSVPFSASTSSGSPFASPALADDGGSHPSFGARAYLAIPSLSSVTRNCSSSVCPSSSTRGRSLTRSSLYASSSSTDPQRTYACTGPYFPTVTEGCGRSSNGKIGSTDNTNDVACLTVSGLLPGHSYTFRVATVTSDGYATTPSLPTTMVATYPLTFPLPFTGPPLVEPTDVMMVRINWQYVKPIDTGGLPLLGYLVGRQDHTVYEREYRQCLEKDADNQNNICSIPFGHYIVLPATVMGNVSTTAPEGNSIHRILPVPADYGYITGLRPNTTYRFIVSGITAMGVALPSEPTEWVTTLALPPLNPKQNSSYTRGHLSAILTPRGKVRTTTTGSTKIQDNDDTIDNDISLSNFDPLAPVLNYANIEDRLALIAALHAATSVAVTHLRSLGIKVRSSTMLERAGIGEEGLVPDETIPLGFQQTIIAEQTLGSRTGKGGRSLHPEPSNIARRKLTEPHNPSQGSLHFPSPSGLGHALGLWFDRVSYATTTASGIDILTSEHSADNYHYRSSDEEDTDNSSRSGGKSNRNEFMEKSSTVSLLPGIGGLPYYIRQRLQRIQHMVKNTKDTKHTKDTLDSNTKRRLLPIDPFRSNATEYNTTTTTTSFRTSSSSPSSPSSSFNPYWYKDTAYWAMATGSVSTYVNALARAYEDITDNVQGMVCSAGICTPPAVAALRHQIYAPLSNHGNNGRTMGTTVPFHRKQPLSPCVSPLVTLSDKHQTVIVHVPRPLSLSLSLGINTTEYFLNRTKSMKFFPSLNIYAKLKNIRLDDYLNYHDVWIIPAWASAWSPKQYDVEAEMMAAEPFTGTKTVLLSSSSFPTTLGHNVNTNEFIMIGRIALMERGAPLTLAEKMQYAIRYGAIGLIIIDDSNERCGTYISPNFSQRCVQGGDKVKNTGFAYLDDPSLWSNNGVRIPTVLIPRDAGLALRKLLSQ